MNDDTRARASWRMMKWSTSRGVTKSTTAFSLGSYGRSGHRQQVDYHKKLIHHDFMRSRWMVLGIGLFECYALRFTLLMRASCLFGQEV
jgi:hypothetical protein